MSAIDKKAFLTGLYQRTEIILEKAISQYQNLDELSLSFSIDDNSWSIVQVLSHLNSYGNYYLPKMEEIVEKNQELPTVKSYKSGWLGAYFVNMMDAGKSNKRYKAAKQHQPMVTAVYLEVAEFINQQERMLKCIKAFETINVNKIKIAISIAKLMKMRIGDVLSFLVTHNERHVIQIERILTEQNDTLSQRAVSTTFAS